MPQVDSTLLGYLDEVFIYQQIQSKPMNNPGKFSFFGSFEHFVSIFLQTNKLEHTFLAVKPSKTREIPLFGLL